jgi:nucleoside-diphosphate-sugar epimerase
VRALITGITGFVGSHLAEYILENHTEVEVAGFYPVALAKGQYRRCLGQSSFVLWQLAGLSVGKKYFSRV